MTARRAYAILGYAVRFPGAANVDEFWSLLCDGRDAVSVVPADRWDADEFFDPDPDAPGKMVARRAGFIDDVAGFDASFFGVSTREAEFMDPQHRLMLETTWTGLEHAGIAPSALAGTRTGVFMGLSTHEFGGMLIRLCSLEDIDFYSATGISAAAGAGRISYRLGLQGPAWVVDTACSSSLVALHQACQALDAGDCDLALVGGVNVILTPIPMINFSRARMLAPDGRCKTFDAAADGYVRGEGCGVLVLKRIDDAQRDGDRIRAVVRGSAVNQDGASGGLTVPNGAAQQRVIADALRRAGVAPNEVDYLEAHGTGTSLGDPIEVRAAGAVFGDGRDPDRPLLIGSVKTNIGHLEAAAGMAGIIKVALALEHEVLPKQLHFSHPSPHVAWDRLSVRVLDEATPWPRAARSRIAGVSSFGFSGTNAHVVLEEAPVAEDASQIRVSGGHRLLPLSARTPQALLQQAARYREWLEANPEAALADICDTAGAARAHFEHRAAVVVDSSARARRLLRALHEDRPAPGLVRGVCTDRPKTAWLFGGQGSQFPGMATTLFETEPVFRETVTRCADVLDGVLTRPLLEVIFDTGSDSEETLRDTAFAQPALFAVEMGLARLWQSWGIEPDAVLGHSVGQYAAACVAGVFGIDDGARLIAERGRLFGQLPAGGGMLAVFADAHRVEEYAAGFPRLSVAAYNGASTVLSGPIENLEQVATLSASASGGAIRCEWLDTSHAFHSALIDPVLDEFESFASQFEYSPPQLVLVCNRSGNGLIRRARLDAQYWRRHARQPVRFADSVGTLADMGCTVLMELGPQPILTAAALRIWPDTAATPRAIASLRRDTDVQRCLVEALAAAYTSGHQLNFAGQRARPHRSVDLPTYPFQHRTYWFPAFTAPDMAERARAGASWSGQSRNGVSISSLTDALEPQAFPAGDWLSQLAPDQRVGRIGELICTALAEVLHASESDIDLDAEFIALGMDSLTALDLHRRLQAMLGTAIPVSLFFAHPTPAALAERLLATWQSGSLDPEQVAIARVSRDGELRLSHAEEQLWFLNQLLPSSSAYNVATRVNIPGSVDREVLQRSLDALVARHEVLRTTFRSVRGVPQAVVGPPQPVRLPFERLHTEAEVSAAAAAEAVGAFDIGVGPLLRARLFGLGEQRHVLVLTMHHIITDGWSFRVLLRELALIYQALERGEPSPLGELPIQYRDYAHWQRKQLHGKGLDALVEFWRKYLAGAPPLELDTDRPRPTIPTFRGERMHFDLGRDLATALRELCRSQNVTVSVPLLTALTVVLQHFSGQDDLVVGTLTGNRTRLETEDLPGLFVNALPVRIRLDGNPDIAELLTRIRQQLVDVLAHQDLPFDLIVNATAPDRDANRNPLFGVQFVMQPATGATALDGLGLEVAEIDTHTAKRDLTFTFFDDELIAGHAEYATELFDAPRIEQLVAHLRLVLAAMVSDLRQRLSELPVLTESERAHYRTGTAPPPTPASSIPELFEMTVDRVPDAVAVRADGNSLTYRELDAASNRLARRLRRLGVRAGTAVGFSSPRTVGMAIGMLAILKAGGVYVPIEPSYPKDRVDVMLNDAGVMLLLDQRELESPAVQRESVERLQSVAAPDELAYVMYTSGSTGRPKGVAVTNRGLVEYIQTLGRELAIVHDDVYLETASISFSSSIRQLLVPLAIGAQVVIATTEERRDPAALLRRIDESHVTVADLVPTVVRGILEIVGTVPLPSRLRLLLTASEPLRVGVVRAWRDWMGSETAWINMYGQTETTGIVSLHRLGEVHGSDQSIVPIGRPRGNVGMYVLDQRMRLVPPGVSGELFIAGDALAREYLGDAALTARKFVSAPWDRNERLYASGDVVRIGWDGTIVFRNRTDRQMKIRGLRVEPAEIDQVLLDHPGVREAVTLVQNADGRPSVLVAYVVVEAGSVSRPVSVGELRDHVRRRLPEHMVPAAFVMLERLPQTLNGKLDRAALPEVTISRDPEVDFVPPRAGLEELLASIWRGMLPVEQIGAADNFFALGGHSLLAAQVRSRIHQMVGVQLPLEALFEHQTLAELARRIEETGTGDGELTQTPPLRRAARGGTMPASYAQERIWQAECDDPGAPAHWIDVSVRIAGSLEAALLVSGVQHAVRRHELLRTVFRHSAASLSQVILDSYVPDVPVAETISTKCTERREDLRDLDARPPFRAEVLRIADDHHILRLRAHRLIADGHSMRVLLGEIGRWAAKELGINDVSVPDSELQYADYAVWEREWLTGEALTRRVDYFRGQFAVGELPPDLPTDYPRRDRHARQGRQYAFEFPPEIADTARALAVREQASLYVVLVAAFAIAVGSYADRSAVVIGAPVTRRSDPATQLMIGPFMNTVPLRVDLQEVATGADLPALIRDVKAKVLGALANQDAPWQYVRAALEAEHGSIARGIGEVALLMDEPVPAEFSSGGFAFRRVPPERIVVRRDLTVAMSATGGRISGAVTYDGALFEPRSIEQIVANFTAALSCATPIAPEAGRAR